MQSICYVNGIVRGLLLVDESDSVLLEELAKVYKIKDRGNFVGRLKELAPRISETLDPGVNVIFGHLLFCAGVNNLFCDRINESSIRAFVRGLRYSTNPSHFFVAARSMYLFAKTEGDRRYKIPTGKESQTEYKWEIQLGFEWSKKSTELDTQNSEAWKLLAQISELSVKFYGNKRAPDRLESIKAITNALKYAPTDLETNVLAAEILEFDDGGKNAFEMSVGLLQKGAGEGHLPKRVEEGHYTSLLEIAIRKGEASSEEMIFDQWCKVDPSPVPLIKRAELYQGIDDEKTLEFYKQVLRLDPGYIPAEIYVFNARMERRIGDPNDLLVDRVRL